MNFLGLRHISKRKKITKKVEEYPSPKFWIGLFDRIILTIAVVGPLTALPQVWNVYANHVVSGLSLTSWSLWAFFNLFWAMYGFVHKEKPIILTYLLWFLMNSSIAIGILLYS